MIEFKDISQIQTPQEPILIVIGERESGQKRFFEALKKTTKFQEEEPDSYSMACKSDYWDKRVEV